MATVEGGQIKLCQTVESGWIQLAATEESGSIKLSKTVKRGWIRFSATVKSGWIKISATVESRKWMVWLFLKQNKVGIKIHCEYLCYKKMRLFNSEKPNYQK